MKKTRNSSDIGWLFWAVMIYLCIAYGKHLAPFSAKSGINSETPSSGQHSFAYSEGVRAGRMVASTDRSYDNYKGMNHDDESVQKLCHYSPGTAEYGDFWAGYTSCYSEAR